MVVMSIGFVSVQINNDGTPYGMDRMGQWWYWNRTTNRWEQGYWAHGPMLTPTDHV
jgi:hypothetical protein